MKKILAWVLLVTMILGMFAGCGKQETPATEPAGEVITAQDAIEYLKALYPKSEDAMKTPVNFDRMGIIRIGGIPFTVVWTTDLPEEQIKVIVSEDGATVTLDVNEKCESDTPYVLTATITDEQGNSASTTWNCVLPQAVDMVSLVKEAYALKSGESLPYEATLTGKIVSIDTVYNPEYKNITVTIAVEGAEDMPIQCYRLKGEGAENLAVGNIITVTGTLKNYNGTIEFDAGCMLDAVEQGDAVVAPTDPGEILKAAYKLKKGKSLPYPVTLTGKVTSIDKPFDPAYNNISVVLTVDGYKKYPILCYRLKGTGAEDIALEDTITVTGIIKNYEGTIEYDAGCMLVERISGGNTAQKPSDDEAKILKDVKKLKDGEKLPYVAILTGQVFSVDEAYTDEYKNITVTMKVGGMRIKAFRMKGDDVKKVKPGDTITVSGQMENYGGVIEFSSGCMMTDRKAGNGSIKVELGPVENGKEYYAEMFQGSLNKNLYFNGKISNSYLQTTENPAQAVKIQVEEVSGKGTRFYFMDGETKTYIEIMTNDEGKQRTTLVTEPTAYWNYDSEYKVYFFSAKGVYCALGTFSTNNSISATKLGFLSTSNIGKSQFVVKFVEEPSAAPEQPPVTPDEPVTPPAAAVTELKTGDQVVIFAPAYNKALSTETVATYYQKGIDVTVANGEVTGYGATSTWTVTVNSDGSYSFANGGKNIALASSYSSMKLGEVNDDWTLESLGGTLYNIKNVVRGNYMEWYAAKNNWSTVAASNAATDDQFQLSIYVIGKGLLGGESTEPETPPVTPDEPEQPTDSKFTTTLKNGDKVVIFAPAYNKALSVEKLNASSYYNKGITVTVDGDTLTGYGETEIWTVVDNGDGTYSFTGNDGKNIAMQASYASLAQGAVNDDWQLIQLANGTCALKNSVRGNYIQWAKSFSNYSTYNGNPETDDQFQLKFYVVESAEPEAPAEPSITTTLTGGTKVVIFAPAYNKALSVEKLNASSYYNKGITVTVDGDTLTGYGETEIWTVVDNGDGTYSFTGNDGKNIAMQASYASLAQGAVNDDWQLIQLANGTCALKNSVRGNYIQWAKSFSNYSTYNGNPETDDQFQLKFYVVEAGEPETPVTPPADPDGTVLTIPEAVAMGSAMADKTFTTTKYKVTGVIDEIVKADYGNVYIKDAAGNRLYVYGIYDITGATRYDALDPKPVVGDTVTLLGVVGNFGGAQMKSGWLQELIPGTPVTPPVTPDEPVTPPATSGGSADFDTFPTSTGQYTGTHTTTNGWTAVNSAIQSGGPNVANPAYPVVGPDNTYKAVCLNGKTSAAGKLTSPTLTGGISKLTINYTKMFTDTALSVTVTITDAAGNKQTHVIAKESVSKDEKYVVYTDEWTLETPVTGEFTMEIVNNCPTNQDKNKDRMTILSVEWEGAAPAHTHEYTSTTTATCTAAGTTTYTCSCGDTYSEDVEKLGHIDENLDIDCDRAGCTSKVAPAADSTLSVFTANNLGSKLSSSYSYYVEGTIVEVLDAKNGIFLISDGVGTETFYIRLPKNAEGVSHSSWQVKLVLGDKIKVYGKINKYTTSSAPNGSYYPASQGGLVTILEQHPHTFGDPTCTEPGYCLCGQSGPAALNHIDANSDNACDRCSWNMKHAIEMLTTKCEDIKNTDKLDTTNGTATFTSENFKATFTKGTGTLNTNGSNHMRMNKGNILTVSATSGKKIAGLTLVTTTTSYVDELEACLTALGYSYKLDGIKATIYFDAVESFELVNADKVQRIASIEVIYEK